MSKLQNNDNSSNNSKTVQVSCFEYLKEDSYGYFQERSKKEIERIYLQMMEEEVAELGLPRNGYYKAGRLYTLFGSFMIKIPKVKGISYRPGFLVPHSPFSPELLFIIQSMYLGGMSQREITRQINSSFNLNVTRRQIEKAISRIIKPGMEFLERDLSEHYYPVLFVDAYYVPIREAGKVSKKAVMNAIALRDDGVQEILGTDIQSGESVFGYSGFFRKLQDRGLKTPEMIISDSHAGLREAILENFPLTLWRRCCFHMLQTAGKESGFDSAFLRGLSETLLQENPGAILKDTAQLLKKYKAKHPKLAALIEEALPDLANFIPSEGFGFLTATNNRSESLNSILRIRTDAVRVFPDFDSYYRLIGNILTGQSLNWSQDRQAEERLLSELLERKENRVEKAERILEESSRLFPSDISKAGVLWLTEIFRTVTLDGIHLGFGIILAYACDIETGRREPIACSYIIRDREKALEALLEKIKEGYDTDYTFLVVAPLSLSESKDLVQKTFPGAAWQTDTSDLSKAISSIVPKDDRKEIEKDLAELFNTKVPKVFGKRAQRFERTYADRFPRAVKLLKKYLPDLGSYCRFEFLPVRLNRISDKQTPFSKALKNRVDALIGSGNPYPGLKEFREALIQSAEEVYKYAKKAVYLPVRTLKKYLS